MITITALPPGDRVLLTSMFDAYADEMRDVLAGTAPASGAATAAMLDADPHTEILTAWADGLPVGFAIFFDLPEAVFARRCGALDDLYVLPTHRGRGIARTLVEALTDLGRARRWSHLRWIVPEGDQDAIALYERIATRADWRSYVIRLDPDASL